MKYVSGSFENSVWHSGDIRGGHHEPKQVWKSDPQLRAGGRSGDRDSRRLERHAPVQSRLASACALSRCAVPAVLRRREPDQRTDAPGFRANGLRFTGGVMTAAGAAFLLQTLGGAV